MLWWIHTCAGWGASQKESHTCQTICMAALLSRIKTLDKCASSKSWWIHVPSLSLKIYTWPNNSDPTIISSASRSTETRISITSIEHSHNSFPCAILLNANRVGSTDKTIQLGVQGTCPRWPLKFSNCMQNPNFGWVLQLLHSCWSLK